MQCVITHTRRCYMFSSAGWPALESRGLSQYSKPLQVPCAWASALSVWAVLSVICLQSKQGLSNHMAIFCNAMNVSIISTHWGIQAPPFLDKTEGWDWVVGDIMRLRKWLWALGCAVRMQRTDVTGVTYFAPSIERTWPDYISLLIIFCIIEYVTNKTLNPQESLNPSLHQRFYSLQSKV